MKKILALLLACIMLTAVLTGCGNKRASTETAAQPTTAEQTDATASDGATYTLKLAHDANTTSAYQLSALELKRMIEEKSDGRIKVEVYPAQQLGSAQEMIEGMQMGTIEATLLPTAKFGGFDQTMNILDMPFLFPGITWLMGGNYNQVAFAVQNMIANLTGMICDGAKPSCALKVTTGVSTAVLSAMMAMEDRCVTSVEGIIDEDVDQSIRNLTRIGSQAMNETDKMVLDIMTHKGC